MPKIISPEMKFKVISLFYCGHSRDEIAQTLGLGKGTVSKYLDEFRKEIGNPTFETIKVWGRFLRTHQIVHEDALTGIRIAKLIERYNVKEEDLDSIFEKISAIISGENEATELLVAANQLLEIKRKTGNSYQKTVSEYEKLSQSVPVLENKKHDLESAIKRLYEEQKKALRLHKTTEEELRQFTDIKSKFAKIGLNLTELPKYHTALVEIKRQGYDATKLLDDLQQVGNLEKQVQTSKKVLAGYGNEIQNAKKDLKSVLEKLGQLKLEYKQFLEAVKAILEFRRNQQDPTTVIQWNKILQQNGLTVVQFDKKLRNYNGLLEYLEKLKEKILSYEQQKNALQISVTNLRKEKQDLITLISKAEIELEEKIRRVKKEIEHLEATNPLRLVYDSKGQLHKVFSTTTIFLKKLQGLLEKKNIRKFSLTHAIDRLIDELNTELKNENR
ncbi:MAG: hypothetical protein IIA82_08025 [Thaumarchaeota archaeon]|nr:hypothetical protein [Nitrososphaerota archaeon]